MFTMAAAEWIFPMVRWIIETFLPQFAMGIYGIDQMTNMFGIVRPLLPMQAVGIVILQWVVVGSVTTGVVFARIAVKAIGMLSPGGW